MWEGETSEALGLGCSRKYNMALVELPESCFEVFEQTFGDYIATGNIVELKEHRECLDDIWGNKPFDGVQIHLEGGDIRVDLGVTVGNYLHQCFRIIPGPLIKISPLFEPM